MALAEALQRVLVHPVLKNISVNQIFAFLQLCSCLKNNILLAQPVTVPITSAPGFLPPSIADFLAESIGIPNECVADCWSLFKDDAWSIPESAEMMELDEQAFRLHGWKHGISKGNSSVEILSRISTELI
jgi:hypothetical protein